VRLLGQRLFQSLCGSAAALGARACAHNARERVADSKEMQSDRNSDNTPVFCERCKSHLRVDVLSRGDYQSLQEQHYYFLFKDELSMLLRVQNLYRRHPAVETIAGDIFQARLFEKVEPTYNATLLSQLADSDFDILDYLRHHAFALLPRLKFVGERVAELGPRIRAVSCPICKVGKLQLDTTVWINPHEISDPV
jgi:hypothetical protein